MCRVVSQGACHEPSLPPPQCPPTSSDEAADNAEDPGCLSFIIMRDTETSGGQERVMSRAAYDLQVLATAHSASCGHPGFVPGDYLGHLDGLAIETTITVRGCAPSACGSEPAPGTACWTGKPSKDAWTMDASAGGRTGRPWPGNGNPRLGSRWPMRWW